MVDTYIVTVGDPDPRRVYRGSDYAIACMTAVAAMRDGYRDVTLGVYRPRPAGQYGHAGHVIRFADGACTVQNPDSDTVAAGLRKMAVL